MSFLRRLQRPLTLALAPFVLLACGSQPQSAPSTSATSTAATSAPAGTPATMETNPPHEVHGRILGIDSGAAGSWSAGILEFRPTDPEVLVVAATPAGPDGRFSIVFNSYRWDIPYAVIAFQDRNGNKQVDDGEDFLGGEVRVGNYRGKNLFLIARAGTFVGDRPLDLDEAEFLLDIRAR